MERILVVNLFVSPKRKSSFSKLVDRVKEAGGQTSTVDYQAFSALDASSFSKYDGIILSGTEALFTRTADRKLFQGFFEALARIDVPILGICGGHQALAIAHGGEVAKSTRRFDGFRTVELGDKDHLLAGLTAKIRVMQSHYEEVKRLPPNFVSIAKSKETKIEAMKHAEKPFYGVQFHPERWNEENKAGKIILENFVERVVGSQT